MTQTINRVIYRAFGLNIVSEFKLSELTINNNQNECIDVVINKADLSERWNQLAKADDLYVTSKNLFMFHIKDTAIFCVQDGGIITVSPVHGADEAKIRLFVLGTCMGSLLMQRKVLPLHGSAIAIDGKVYAFVGHSGAGKSTLASAFIGQDYRLLSDDVIAVTFSPDHIPMVMPAYPQQKLWQESLTEFGMETSRYRSIFDRETKYLVPVSDHFVTKPLPLAGVFELSKTDGSDTEIVPMKGLARLHALFCHTFRSSLLGRFELMDWHFKTTVSISDQIEMYQLRRPSSGFTAPQLVSLVLNTLKKEK
ncbi:MULTISPECIES: aldolase [unclassified Paenibacillus]|uniref:aldolase n=1 Tax=unclassified Paenibacillus TaxID=185978 RepID=UPI0027886B77|nr:MULTISPECIES: aldolase [unclassified Paenibacillus]MDQ0903961.1 hypothetical protein [Paenibacillus sp. V4I7]MDQ0917507.1 hypothetical protein [Paenibacillus sp. V4I5]